MASIPERTTALLQELGHGSTTGRTMNDLMAEARAILTERAKFQSTPAQRAQAEAEYGNNECEIDDNAQTSPGDGGTWVQAWVWLYDDEEAETPPDTPCLDTSFHDHEMNCE